MLPAAKCSGLTPAVLLAGAVNEFRFLARLAAVTHQVGDEISKIRSNASYRRVTGSRNRLRGRVARTRRPNWLQIKRVDDFA
jgi:hypothetical protein